MSNTELRQAFRAGVLFGKAMTFSPTEDWTTPESNDVRANLLTDLACIAKLLLDDPSLTDEVRVILGVTHTYAFDMAMDRHSIQSCKAKEFNAVSDISTTLKKLEELA